MWYQNQKNIRIASSYDFDITPKEDILKNGLFHGTLESINGDLRGGGYDNVLWHANNPAVAQNYIPEAGSRSYVSRDWSNDNISPTDKLHQMIAKKIGHGYAYDITYDDFNRPKSWRIMGEPIKKQDIWEYLESLGYKPNHHNTYEIKRFLNNDTDEFDIAPASHKEKGHLYIGLPKQPLNLKDLRQMPGDLMDPQYHRRDWFQDAQKNGYDGIIINDYLQSRNWGNVEHPSWGLFPNGIQKMNYKIIPATNFDWQDRLDISTTPEFEDWHNNFRNVI